MGVVPIVPIVEPQRLCGECENSRGEAGRGVFCSLFNQYIWDEREAQDCLAYDRVRS